MAVTDNTNTIGSSVLLRFVSAEATVPAYFTINGLAYKPTISLSAILSNKLDITLKQVSMTGSGKTSFNTIGVITISPRVSLSASIQTFNNINGISTISRVSMLGTISPSNGLNGLATLKRVSMSGSGSIQNSIISNITISIIRGLGTGSQLSVITPPAADSDVTITGDTYIVVNLRTKAHCIYRDGSNNAYAKTCSLNFGSNKQKTVTDMFVLGRSQSSINYTMTYDEVTKRTDEISFGQDGQANLRNKKVKPTKGLKAQNTSLAFSSNGDYAEIRNVDLYVSELRRHI